MLSSLGALLLSVTFDPRRIPRTSALPSATPQPSVRKSFCAEGDFVPALVQQPCFPTSLRAMAPMGGPR